jgi:hypothetical protein
MNNRQRCVVLAGFIVIVLMGLYPPWRVTLVNGGLDSNSPKYAFSVPAGYDVIIDHPQKAMEYFQSKGSQCVEWEVDKSLLLVQWFLVSAVTGIVVMFLESRPKCPSNDPSV